MRHLHDLAFLSRCFKVDAKFSDSFRTTFETDVKSRLKSDISFEDISEHVCSALSENKKYEKDFKRYVSNISYAKKDDLLQFEDAVSRFKDLMTLIQKN